MVSRVFRSTCSTVSSSNLCSVCTPFALLWQFRRDIAYGGVHVGAQRFRDLDDLWCRLMLISHRQIFHLGIDPSRSPICRSHMVHTFRPFSDGRPYLQTVFTWLVLSSNRFQMVDPPFAVCHMADPTFKPFSDGRSYVCLTLSEGRSSMCKDRIEQVPPGNQ